MQKTFLILALLWVPVPPNNAAAGTVAVQYRFVANDQIFSYKLGNRSVTIKMTTYGGSKDVVMLNLHDDETTGVEAARTVLEKTGGMLISIENNNQRNITFTQRGKTCRFDPNRIFTKAGIKATLLEQNKHSSKSVINPVHGFARFLLNKVPTHTFALIALHNNDDAGLSILSYIKAGDLEKDAAAVYKSDVHDPDNFFLTTDGALFRKLRAAGYNTILQHKKAKDDGSLSVYYGRRNKRYINIEAETGNVKEQTEMIKVVVAMIRGAAE